MKTMKDIQSMVRSQNKTSDQAVREMVREQYRRAGEISKMIIEQKNRSISIRPPASIQEKTSK